MEPVVPVYGFTPCARAGEVVRLYVNMDARRFAAASASRLPPHGAVNTLACERVDVDANGALDLVLANGPLGAVPGQDWLWRNDGAGNFTDLSSSLPPDNDWSEAIVAGDVNGDGQPDLIFANATSAGGGAPNRLLLNVGNGFIDATQRSLPFDTDASVGVLLVAVDRANGPDLVFVNQLASQPPGIKLYLNDSRGAFADVSNLALPPSGWPANAAVAADLDEDGDPDLVVADGTFGLHLWANGAGRFTEVPRSAAFGNLVAVPFATRHAAGDVERDGDVDFVCTYGIARNLARHVGARDPARGPTLGARRLRATAGRRTAAGFRLARLRASRDAAAAAGSGHARARPPPLHRARAGHRHGDDSVDPFVLPLAPVLVGTRLHAQALILHGNRAALTNLYSDPWSR